MLISGPEVSEPRSIRLASGVPVSRCRARACRPIPPSVEPLIRRQCACCGGSPDHTPQPILQVSRFGRRRSVRCAGESEQWFINACPLGVHRIGHAADRAAVPLRMNVVAVVQITRRRSTRGLSDASTAVVVLIALGHCACTRSGGDVQMLQRIPSELQRGRAWSRRGAVCCGLGNGAACAYLA